MLIPIVAFNPKDALSAARMLNWSADLCGQQSNVCVLAYEPGTPADDVQRAASRAFATVEHLPVRSKFDSWPGSAGDYFAITAQAMRGRAPWAWLEPDCVMIHPKTLSMLEADFMRAAQACLGTVIPMFFERDGVYQQIGEMLAGVAVYHPNIADRSPLLRSLRQYNAAYAASGVPPRAFDSYLANDLVKIAARTPLIQHMGRSRNFRREEGKIVCTYGPESLWSPVVAPETALVHGVKDSSLIDLLRAEMNLPERAQGNAPVAVVRTIETTRRAAAPTAWGKSDALPPERPANGVKGFAAESFPMKSVTNKATIIAAPGMEALKIRIQASSEHATAISEARDAIQHWPECKSHVFTLNIGRNERYRVLCQCGAMSGKLPEGVEWPQVWEAQTPVDEQASITQDSEQLVGEEVTQNLTGHNQNVSSGVCSLLSLSVKEEDTDIAELILLIRNEIQKDSTLSIEFLSKINSEGFSESMRTFITRMKTRQTTILTTSNLNQNQITQNSTPHQESSLPLKENANAGDLLNSSQTCFEPESKEAKTGKSFALDPVEQPAHSSLADPAFAKPILKVTQVRLGTNGGSVIFEDGSSQLVTKGQIVKAKGRVAKKQRTAEEQAKIDLRMASLRARKVPFKKARRKLTPAG